MSLENAPDDVKLAVDLIVLLEENQIPARTVLRALDIVKRDYEKKLTRDDEAEKWYFVVKKEQCQFYARNGIARYTVKLRRRFRLFLF